MGQYSLGRCFEFGLGIPQFDEMAFFWYLKSAESGYNEAMYSLALCYHKGYGCIKDENKAGFWLNKAAELDHKLAGNELKHYKKNFLGKYRRIDKDE